MAAEGVAAGHINGNAHPALQVHPMSYPLFKPRAGCPPTHGSYAPCPADTSQQRPPIFEDRMPTQMLAYVRLPTQLHALPTLQARPRSSPFLRTACPHSCWHM